MKKALYAVSIIYLIFILFFTLMGRTNLFSVRALNVISGSMESTIKTGETIIIYKNAEYNVGDIITFVSENNYVTHRIVEIHNDKVITKGDANNTTDDEEISVDAIIGKVILIVPIYYGFLAKFFGGILVILLIISSLKRKDANISE